MANEAPKSQRSQAGLTPEVRIVYPFVHERQQKRANGTPLENPRYSATILLPKTNADPAQCANYRLLWNHCIEAARKMWPQSVDAAGNWVWPQGLNPPILDGDVPYKPKNAIPGQQTQQVDPNKYAWRKGHWQIEVAHILDPGPRVAVMQNGQAVEIPAKTIGGRSFYKSGDYGHVSIYAYAWQHPTGKFGISYGFEGVLFTREGEAVGSSGPKSAAAMFGSVAPVASAPMAAPTAAPTAAAATPPPQQTYAPPVAPVAAPPAAAPPTAPQAYAPPPAAPAPGMAPLPPFPVPGR